MPRRLVERVCWTASALCLAVFAVMHVYPQHAAAKVAAGFASATFPMTNEAAAAPDQTLWSASRIAHYAASSPGAAVGVLRIPALDVRAPIFHGTEERVLNAGVGHVPGSAGLDQPGNIALAAHRDGFFRALKNAAIGQLVELQTRAGLRRFRIVDFEVVAPADTSVLAPSSTNRLTLITCFPFYFVGNAPERFVVYAIEQRRP